MKKNENFFLYKINIKDIKSVFDLSNDKTVRKWSFNKNKIKYKEHEKWFKKRIKQKYFFKLKNKDNICGIIRLDKNKKKNYLSYLISKKYRKNRLGIKMIKLFIKILKRSRLKKVYAISYKKNISSNLTLLKSNFRFLEGKKNINIYYLNI